MISRVRPRALATMAALMSLGLVVSSCSNGGGTTTTSTAPMTSTTVMSAPVGPPPKLKVTPVAKLDKPTAMAIRDGDTSFYIAEKGGTIRTVKNGIVDATPVLDISSEVSNGSEQGLLGIAFAPKSSAFYVDFTDKTGDTHVVEFKLDNGGRADLRTRREILMVKQPYANHNGGQLAFGPDGALYIGMGDGGGEGDPQKNAQNLTSLLGKILRIRPDMPSNGLPYTIPYDNPLTKQPGARAEIWAYGLRNPWRFSFDTKDKSMWIADVGQGTTEEIDHMDYTARGGANYGWPLLEGTKKQDGNAPKDAVAPVYEYDHSGGACSVTGGYVYRGKAIPDMTGRYIFGDFCTGNLSVLTKRGTDWEADKLNIDVPTIGSFGQDADGELYVLGQDGDFSRIDRDQ